jgi:hypothetical protein
MEWRCRPVTVEGTAREGRRERERRERTGQTTTEMLTGICSGACLLCSPEQRPSERLNLFPVRACAPAASVVVR